MLPCSLITGRGEGVEIEFTASARTPALLSRMETREMTEVGCLLSPKSVFGSTKRGQLREAMPGGTL